MYLTITHHTEDGIAVITLTGRLLLGPEGAELEMLVGREIEAGVRHFVFDFAHLTHIDSTGIGRCISSLNQIIQAGGQLGIAGAAGQVRDSFRVTQLDRVFRFFPDLPEAKAAVA